MHAISKYFVATITSGGSVTSDINLGQAFTKVYINIAGATQSVHFLAAPVINTGPGTYAQVKYNVASGMSAPQTVTVGTATSGSYVEVPGLAGFQYIKVVNAGGAADGATMKIIAAVV